MAWATSDDVRELTGAMVGDTDTAKAAAIISAHVGVLDGALLHARDAEWLRRAVCWQAEWMEGQPGMGERSSVTSVSQDGLSATYVDQAAIVLAPMARRVIKNLSWMGTRSISTTRRSERPLNRYDVVDAPDCEWSGI